MKNLDTVPQCTYTIAAAKICTGCVIRKVGPSERLNKEKYVILNLQEQVVEVTLESKLNAILDLPLFSSVSSITPPTVHLDMEPGVENGS